MRIALVTNAYRGFDTASLTQANGVATANQALCHLLAEMGHGVVVFCHARGACLAPTHERITFRNCARSTPHPVVLAKDAPDMLILSSSSGIHGPICSELRQAWRKGQMQPMPLLVWSHGQPDLLRRLVRDSAILAPHARYAVAAQWIKDALPDVPNVAVLHPWSLATAQRDKEPPREPRFIVMPSVSLAKGGPIGLEVARRITDVPWFVVPGRCIDADLKPWRELKHVTVSEPVEEAELMRRAAVMLSPTHHEAYGLALRGAVLRGIPVVASDLPGMQEVCGTAAIRVPLDAEIDEWVRAVRLALAGGLGTAPAVDWRGEVAGVLGATALAEAVAPTEGENVVAGGVVAVEEKAGAPPPLLPALPDPPQPTNEVNCAEPDQAEHHPPPDPEQPETQTMEPVPESDRPAVFFRGGWGQLAFVDGLVEQLGFRCIDEAEAEAVLRSGRPVVFNGSFGRPLLSKHVGGYVAWHSGFAGSDLMGEGGGFPELFDLARQGRVFWLERRDDPPPGAVLLPPVWSPKALTALASPTAKEPGAVAVGLTDNPCKNILAAVRACVSVGAKVHLSREAAGKFRGMALRTLLDGHPHTFHDRMTRAETATLLASCELLVHPSFSDTWPYLALEAVYAGTPVVLSDTVAWSADLTPWARKRCVARPATSTVKIADLVRNLLENPKDRERLLREQRACLDRIAEKHTEEARKVLTQTGFLRTPGDVAAAANRTGNGIDLSADLTVFVIASGEPTTADCLDRLRQQDCRFRLEVVQDVAPMWRAFQQMIARCETPFYVQVDADMLLERHAVRTLHSALKTKGPDVAMWCGWLWDDDVERPIQGVKVYRHAVLKQYPYQDALSCEVPQLQAMKAGGFRFEAGALPADRGGCLGQHCASATPMQAFYRWQRLMQKYRALPWMAWLGPYPARLLEKWRKAPSDTALARVLGAASGLSGALPPATEADWTMPPDDFKREMGWFSTWERGPQELTLYLTDECNFKCTFCLRQLGGGCDTGRMSLETVRQAVERFPTLKSACIAGFGEPLLHPDLSRIVEYLKSKRLFVGIITNGALLKRRIGEIATVAPGHVSVSLNACTAEEHAERHGGVQVWDDVLAGVEACVAKNIRTGLSCVVGRSNVGTLPDFLALAKRLGVAFVNLVNLLPHGDPADPAFVGEVLTTEDADSLAAIESARKAPGAELVQVWPTPIDLDGLCPRRCDSPFVSVGVDARGRTSGCRRIFPPGEAPVAYRIDSAEAWHSPHLRDLRLGLCGDLPMLPQCARCFGNWSR